MIKLFSGQSKYLALGLALAALYLLLAAAATQMLPFSRALDEGYHLEYITFIKEHGRLPISYEERATITRADFPPLYHLLVAAVSAPVAVTERPDFKYFWDSFRYRVVDHQIDQPWTFETEDFQPPYLGRFWVWQIGRLLSVGLSLGTVLVIFLALRELPLPDQPFTALAGAALIAFIPRFLLLGAALNDDNLLGLVAGLYFLALLRAVKQPQRWPPFVALGILLGVSLTVKYTLVVAPLELVVLVVWLARRQKLGWGWAVKRLAAVAGLAAAASSWWFGWNLWFLNTIAKDGFWAGITRPLLAGGHDTTLNRLGGLVSQGQVGLTALPENTNIGTFPEWAWQIWATFWAYGVDGTYPLAGVAFPAIGLLGLVVLVGLGRVWRSPDGGEAGFSRWDWVLFLAGHIAIFWILPVVRFWLTRRLSVAAQGRHILIPAAAAVAALVVWGLMAVTPPRWRRLALALPVVLLVGWSGVHLTQIRANQPNPLPVRTIPQAAEWLPEVVNARFGDALELVSYRLDPQPAQASLNLELGWRTQAVVKENYRLRVSLLNPAGEPVSGWQGFNGGGRVPTLAWDPGDSVFDRLSLPLVDLPPGEYTVRVQMVGRSGPLPVGNEDALSLATVTLPAVSGPAFSRQVGDLPFALWRAGGPANEPLPEFRYPAGIGVLFAADPPPVWLVDEAGQAWSPVWQAGRLVLFEIGPRWQSGVYRLRVEQGGEIIETGPLVQVNNWQKRLFDLPEAVEVPLPANFADQVHLLGYKLPQAQVRPGEAFPVTLYWQAPADHPPLADFIQFNHLLGPDGQLHGGYDRRPLEYYSTLLWAPGEVVVDGYAVPVDVDAPPGQYWLDVGFYLTVGEAAVNLPLMQNGQMSDVTSVRIGPVEVVE